MSLCWRRGRCCCCWWQQWVCWGCCRLVCLPCMGLYSSSCWDRTGWLLLVLPLTLHVGILLDVVKQTVLAGRRCFHTQCRPCHAQPTALMSVFVALLAAVTLLYCLHRCCHRVGVCDAAASGCGGSWCGSGVGQAGPPQRQTAEICRRGSSSGSGS